MYVPTSSLYRPLTEVFIGQQCRVITDLNLCELYPGPRGAQSIKTRVYSVHVKVKGKWRLAGHANRIRLDNVSTWVSETTRQKVIARREKTPHSYICGELVAFGDIDNHESLINDHDGYVAYDPYRAATFLTIDHPRISQCTHQEEFISAETCYLYEHGIVIEKPAASGPAKPARDTIHQLDFLSAPNQL